MFKTRSAAKMAKAALLALIVMTSLPVVGLAKERKDRIDENVAPLSQMRPSILITTTDGFDGYRIKEYRGIVRGVTVRQPTIGQGLKADLKGIVGGKMSPFISMCETAREAALDILMQRAQLAGANAVVGVRYDSSAFGDSDDMGTEVVCYGTAVVIEPRDGKDLPEKGALILR